MLTAVAVSGYRSLRDVVVPLHGLDVVTGANGSGKSSLYRSLRLLAGCGRGDVIGTLAREVGLQLGFASDDFGYLVDLGLPQQASGSDAGAGSPSAFLRDPEIKREVVWSGPVMRPGSVLVRRRWGVVETRAAVGGDDDWASEWGGGGDDESAEWESDPVEAPGSRAAYKASEGSGARAPRRAARPGWTELTRSIRPWESMLTELADPERAPELLRVRRMIRGWRFYDGFRADAEAPVRTPQVGTRTPVLADDGRDLAAALQTIRENGRSELDRAVADAFDGAILEVTVDNGRFDVALHQPGMLRPLAGAELSDGTLRYLLLVAALLTPDPPPLMVLNEPETSLHPELLAPLARLIRAAAERSQVMVVSHADALVRELDVVDADEEDVPVGLGSPARGVTLVKDLGETLVQGKGMLTNPAWTWGTRRR